MGVGQQVLRKVQALVQGQLLQPTATSYLRQLTFPPAIFTHSSSLAQTFPHRPQLSGSLETSTQLLLHCESALPGQADAHPPSAQKGVPAGQTAPQVWQLLGSAWRSTQAVPHRLSPGRHWQALALQTSVS